MGEFVVNVDPDSTPRTADLASRAARAFPGGVVTAFDRTPFKCDLVVTEAKGSKLYDGSRREYIDYIMGVGTVILGHAHPQVVEAVRAQLEKGSVYYVRNLQAIELAETIIDATPCAEQLRFAPSGGEANAYALRLACACTGRRKVLKFEGAYHGAADRLLVSVTPRQQLTFPAGEAESDGMLAETLQSTLIAPYNDLKTTEEIILRHGGDLAAIIVEPVQRTYGPEPGFLEGLRRLATQTGALLIFDEVVTGFRFGWGSAQGYFGVTPDLATFGKAIGGGFPIGAVVGPRVLMETFEPSELGRGVFAGSTFLGNPVSAVAGLATLNVLKQRGVYEQLFSYGSRVRAGLQDILSGHGLVATVVGEGPSFHVYFKEGPVRDYRSTLGGRPDLACRFFEECLRRGVVLSHSAKSHISLAHDDSDLARTLEVFAEAATATAGTAG